MEIPLYSRDFVKQNNGKDGNKTWIIIKKAVYDVTDYLDEHPGSPNLILEYAGKDATEAFNDAGHSSDAVALLKKFKIGELVKDDPSVNEFNGNSKEFCRSIISVLTCGMLQ